MHPTCQPSSSCGNQKMSACMLSCFSRVRLFAIPWTAACQAPLSMGFLRQENSSDLPISSPVDLPDSGIEPASLSLLHWLCAYSLSCATPWTVARPDSSVHGILQTRILKWVDTYSSKGSSRPRGQIQISRIAGGFFTV